jgi:hypothetical protein
VAKFKRPRIGGKHADARRDAAAAHCGEHDKPEDPLQDVHVHSPRWRPPISSTPEENDAKSEEHNDEISEDDDTLEFELRRTPVI